MQVQRFRWRNIVEVIEVHRDASGQHYSHIEDVQDLFEGACRFKINGISILFLRDETGKRYEPLRIGHYPDDIIDVMTVHDQPQRATYSIPCQEQPASDQERPHPGQPTLDVHVEELAVSKVPPKSPSLIQASASPTVVPTDSLSASSSSSLSGDEPVSTMTFAGSPSTTTDISTAPISHSRTVSSACSTSPENTQPVSDSQPQLDHSTDEQSAQQHAQVMARFDEVLQRQQQTNDRLEVLQQTADAILIQNYELHEYPIPRLFVILPESINPSQIEDGSTASPGEEPSGFLEKVWNWDPRSLVEERFKLYFLCECGEHSKADTDMTTPTTKPPQRIQSHTQGRHPATSLSSQLENRVHVAKHEGYELSRPTQFFEQYGPYVLGMLQILKYCMTMATFVSPIVGLCQSDMDKLAEGVKAINDSSLEAINVSIDFLEQKLGLDSGSANDFSNRSSGGIAGILKNMEILEGADLRRLETYLRNKDRDKILGNLYRITTSDGHVKWVCLEHGRISYLEVSMKNFLRTLEVNHGHYDKHLRKVTITLTSSSAIKNFMSQLGSKAPGVNELELTLDWEFDSSDLSRIVSNLEHSNVRILKLDLKDVQRRSRIDVKLPGKGKYNPLLELLANPKIGTLSLKGMEYFGSRTSSLPRTLDANKLRSFHLDTVKASDQLRLAEILSRCPNLVDLRLGLNYSSDQQEDLGLAIGSLKRLEVLHLFGLSDDPEGNVWDHLPVVSAATDRLRELVLVNIHQRPTELSECVQVFKNTLEVLIVDPHLTGLQLVPTDGVAPLSVSGVRPTLWSKLTQLQLTSSVSDATKSLLLSVLPHLCLTHLGLAKDLGSLLKIVNFSPLRSVYLYAVEVSDLAPLWKAFPENGGPSQIESLSLQLISLHDGLTRQLRTLHLKRLWLGRMKTDYQEPEPVQSFDSRRRFPLLDSDSEDDTDDPRTIAISRQSQHNLADLLNSLELSNLEVLAIFDSAPATVERVLAKRQGEFSEHLTIHMIEDPPEEPPTFSTKMSSAKSKDPKLSSKRFSWVTERVTATLLDPQRFKTYTHGEATVLQHRLMRC
ncbi:hypothetical protein EC968_004961 [Mortierella alpina]|nr:hypothetical protein EC968_004961 [Mortierella alpina]